MAKPIYNKMGNIVGWDNGTVSTPYNGATVKAVTTGAKPDQSARFTNNGLVLGTSNASTSSPQWKSFSNLSDAPGGGGGATPPNGNPNPNGLDALLEAWKQQKADAMGRAGDIMGTARKYYDEVKGQIGKKRERFGQMRDEGLTNVVNTFEDVKRQLATNTGEAERGVRARLVASGMGGSALDRGLGKITKDFGYAAGNNTQQRIAQEKENQGKYEDNQAWADARDSENENQWGTANNNANAIANAQMNDTNMNFGNILSNLLNQQQQLQALGSTVGGYNPTPFMANIDQATQYLNGNYGPQQTAKAQGNGAANVADNPLLLEQLKRKQQGLYPISS